MLQKGAKPKAIFDALKMKYKEFSGSYDAIKRLCVRIQKEKGVCEKDVVIPVTTKAGDVAQVDFGYAGKLYDAQRGCFRKVWFFVMLLAHSRHMFVRLVFDQRVDTWIQLHIDAFNDFGGAPRTIVPDNLKAAVIRAAFGSSEPCELQRSYRELARFYGFMVDPTPPRSPEKKGKVESAVKYVKNNFFKPRDFENFQEAQRELTAWVKEIAGQRNHGTTRRKPLELFEEEEQRTLEPLPYHTYHSILWKEARVHRDCHVQFDGGLYSVAFSHVGQKVWLRYNTTSVEIYLNEKRLAAHSRIQKGTRSTQEGHLPKVRGEWRHRSRDFWEQKAQKMGDDVFTYIREVFEQDEQLSLLRTVQAMVTLLEKFPQERAQAACRRARYFGNYSYRGIKDILQKALDKEALPNDVNDTHHPLFQPKYAREIKEFLQ